MAQKHGYICQPAFHGDAHGLLVSGFKKDRPALFGLAGKLRLKATSSDDSVLAELDARS